MRNETLPSITVSLSETPAHIEIALRRGDLDEQEWYGWVQIMRDSSARYVPERRAWEVWEYHAPGVIERLRCIAPGVTWVVRAADRFGAWELLQVLRQHADYSRTPLDVDTWLKNSKVVAKYDAAHA